MSLTTKVIAFAGVLMLLSVFLVAGVVTTGYVHTLSDLSLERLEHLQGQVAGTLQNAVANARRDVSFLAASPSVQNYHAEPEINKRQVEEIFNALIQNTAAYSQIRFIGVDDDGRELVRVERIDGEIHRGIGPELQAKGVRDYFRQSIALEPGEIYVSGIDLNRERGEIVVPHLPVLRIAMPVYPTSRVSGAAGVVIININVNSLFAAASSSLPDDYDLYIANGDGDYLLHPDSSRTFGFEFDQRYRLQDDFVEANELLRGNTNSVRITQQNNGTRPGQVLSVTRSALVPGSDDRQLILGLAAPLTRVNAIANKLVAQSLLITGILAGIGLLLIASLVWHFMRPMREITGAVSNYAGGAWERTGTLIRDDEFGLLARHFEAMTQRLQHQFGELAEERGRLDSLVEAAVDAIVLINEHGIIERCNKAIEPLFGYPPHELVGQNVNVLMSGMHHKNHDEYLKRYLRTGEGKIIGFGREVSGRRKDGKEIPLYLSIGEFSAASGRKFTGILHDISDRKRLEAELQTAANTDPLTGTHNRRYFVEQAELEIGRAQRYQHPLSLMIIDLDLFKQTNDQYGHAAGDAALKMVVEICQQTLREQDTLSRLGGDEFAVLLPETDLGGAMLVAERVSEAVAGSAVPGYTEHPCLSLSIGVATYDTKGNADFEAFMSAADRALYEAKSRGRGRVEAA